MPRTESESQRFPQVDSVQHNMFELDDEPMQYTAAREEASRKAHAVYQSIKLHRGVKRYSLQEPQNVQMRAVSARKAINRQHIGDLPLDADSEEELLGILKVFMRTLSPVPKIAVRNAHFQLTAKLSSADKSYEAVRYNIAPVEFQFSQHRVIHNSIQSGKYTQDYWRQIYAKHNNKHASLSLDELEVFDKMCAMVARTQVTRNIDPKKPIKIVFLDYENAMISNNDKEKRSELASVMLDSKCKLTIKDNTIYILMSEKENGTVLQELRDASILDAHVFMDMPEGLEDARFGNPSVLPPLKLFSHLSSLDLFKRAIIMQTVRALRVKLNAKTVDVVLIGGTQDLRAQVSLDAVSHDFDSLVQIKPHSFTAEHVFCVLGTCDDSVHTALSDTVDTSPVRNSRPYSKCNTVQITELQMVAPFNREEAGAMPIEYNVNSKKRKQHISKVTMLHDKKADNSALGRITFGDSKYKLTAHNINSYDLISTLFCVERAQYNYVDPNNSSNIQ